MSDIFTIKTVPLTPELGMALKNFRIKNNVTAKSITEKFGKASSYVSKLEKGEIKKIEADFLINLCNYIVKSDDGLSTFLSQLGQNYREYSDESKIIVMNIDELLYEHTLPKKLVLEIKEYLLEHEITPMQLVDMINANTDISAREDYENLPLNIWYEKDNDINNLAIKFLIPFKYIEDFLNHKIATIHRVILEGILYSLYKLGKEEFPSVVANEKLAMYSIDYFRNLVITSENIDNIFGGLEPDTAEALKEVTYNLKLITNISKNYGAKRIKQISKNMEEDLGFAFAFMSVDIVELEKKDKEKKTQFLKELRELVDKYSQEDTGIDLYE